MGEYGYRAKITGGSEKANHQEAFCANSVLTSSAYGVRSFSSPASSSARMTEEEMRRLWLAAKEFEHTIAEGNLVKLAEADVAFHEVIYQASDNKRLIQVLNNMREQIYRYRVEYLKEGETRDVLVKEHEELTKAIRERDVERAKQLSFQHIENQRMAIMRSIEAEDAERERAEKEKSRGHR